MYAMCVSTIQYPTEKMTCVKLRRTKKLNIHNFESFLLTHLHGRNAYGLSGTEHICARISHDVFLITRVKLIIWTMKFTCPSLSSHRQRFGVCTFVLVMPSDGDERYFRSRSTETHHIKNAAYVRNTEQKIHLKSHEIQM